jgi:glyoxylase-like metal-dependent hydrolase (beta-lactamase superfamily II)
MLHGYIVMTGANPHTNLAPAGAHGADAQMRWRGGCRRRLQATVSRVARRPGESVCADLLAPSLRRLCGAAESGRSDREQRLACSGSAAAPRCTIALNARNQEQPMSTAKKFASQADLQEKQVSFDKLSEHAYAFTAEGDPNTGIVVGDNAVMVIDTQATPVMAQDVIRRIREVTDKPIKYVVLSHYHAVRVLGASGYRPEHIVASRDTYDLIVERGEQDMKSEIERFPRLFRAVESVPGLTWPTLVFEKRMTLWLGKLQVEIMQLGRGHTKGDTVVWLPQEKILFSGDLVEYQATPYTGDAYLTDWPATLDAIAALKPEKLVPGRGASLQTPAQVQAGLDGTRSFITEMFETVKRGAAGGKDLRAVYKDAYAVLQPKFGQWVIFDHCLPFDVSRAYDEATQYRDPRIWTAARDKEMWQALEV